jgi:hypothetical protein
MEVENKILGRVRRRRYRKRLTKKLRLNGLNLLLPLYLPVELVGGNSTVNLSDESRSNHPSHSLA